MRVVWHGAGGPTWVRSDAVGVSAGTGIERPPEAVAVADRYRRRERPVSWLVALLAVAVFLGVYVATSLLPAVGVAAVLLVAMRAPLVQSRGTFRLRTDADPATVRAAFTGPTPPVVALQWGIADAVTMEGGTATYRTSYLFGLRTAVVSVRSHVDALPDGGHRVELDVTLDDAPWATYTATITPTDEGASIDVAYTSERRFGLRRLPQQLVAARYRDAALAAQGYAVVGRNASVGR